MTAEAFDEARTRREPKPLVTAEDRAAGLRHMYRLVRIFQPDWRPFLVSGLTATATSFCEAGTLILLTLTAATIASGADEASKTIAGIHLEQGQMLAIAGALLVLRLIFTWINSRTVARLATKALLGTRRRVLETFIAADWERQSRQEQGLLLDLLASRAELVSYSSVILTGVLVSGINLLVLAGAALVLQPLAVLALGFIGVVLTLVLRPLNRLTRTTSRAYLRENVIFLAHVTDLSHNARDLNVFGVGGAFRDRVMAQQEAASELYRRKNLLTQFTPQAYQTIGLGLAVAGLAAASAFGGSNLATLGAVVLLLLRGISYGQSLMIATQAVNERVPWLTSMVEALEEFERLRLPPGTEIPSRNSDLVLQGVTYRYGEASVLHHIDLEIPHGQRLGVVGPSGSGKSTLLQILAGLRRPTEGSYQVGGVELRDVEPAWWAKEMALVSQDAKLLTESVRENIAFLRDLPPGKVEEAAQKAQLAPEVEALGGYDVGLSREKRALSGGQLQRLAIARALAGDPGVLLLDEPTSALDVGTEARLERVLAGIGGTTTMVIVAHRLSTVASCDRIIVLEHGDIIADGPPGTVLEAFGADAVAEWELEEEADGQASGAEDQVPDPAAGPLPPRP